MIDAASERKEPLKAPGNVGFDMPQGECADRDPARSYERLDTSDLARLGRAAPAELDAFFARNPHLAGWRDRVRIIALAQGGAEHYLRGRRGKSARIAERGREDTRRERSPATGATAETDA